MNTCITRSRTIVTPLIAALFATAVPAGAEGLLQGLEGPRDEVEGGGTLLDNDTDQTSGFQTGRGARFEGRPTVRREEPSLRLVDIAPAAGEGGARSFLPPQGVEDEVFPNIRPLPDFSRSGASNPCGPYGCLVTDRSFDPSGRPQVSWNEAYRRMAPSHFGLGTGPQAMERFLIQRGHNAWSRNGMTTGELADAIDRGQKGLILVNTNRDPEGSLKDRFGGLHWMPVKGYRTVTDAEGNQQRYFQFEDTAYARSGAFRPGGRYPNGIPEKELQQIWDQPVPWGARSLSGNPSGYFIGVDERQPTLLDRARHASYWDGDRTRLRVAMDGLYDATRGFDRTFGRSSTLGDRLGGATQMVAGGGIKTGLNILPAGVSTVGNVIESGGDAMLSWGQDRWRRGGALNRSAAIGATAVGSIPKVAGWTLEGVGNVGSSALGVTSDVIQGVGNWTGRRVDDTINGARAVRDWVGSWFQGSTQE